MFLKTLIRSYMKKNYDERIKQAKAWLNDADYILIGAGAGLSTAAGFEYGGAFFQKNFQEFAQKYGIKDMYSGGFYPFKTQEEKWAFWSKMVYFNRYKANANPTYQALFNLIKNKDYFVITTNVDHQFQLAGFDKNRLFYMQGDYGLFQCSVPCHNQTYDNQALVLEMIAKQKDGKIPSSLVPKCPMCGRDMEMNLRSDNRFVQDEGWYRHAELYQEFIEKAKHKKLVLIEIGVGYNTPAIIKYPFESMVYRNQQTTLIRINKDHAVCDAEIADQTILFNENTVEIINALKN